MVRRSDGPRPPKGRLRHVSGLLRNRGRAVVCEAHDILSPAVLEPRTARSRRLRLPFASSEGASTSLGLMALQPTSRQVLFFEIERDAYLPNYRGQQY